MGRCPGRHIVPRGRALRPRLYLFFQAVPLGVGAVKLFFEVRVLGVDHPAGLRHGFDVLATHLPIFERTAPGPGRNTGGATGFRFVHRQWFDVLRAQSKLTAV